MSRVIIAPYRFAPGALRLACQLTGLDFEQTPSGDWLWSGDGTPTGKFHVAFEVRGTAAAIQQSVPPAEMAADVWRVAVIMKSATSRSRRLTFLDPSGADSYRGSAALDTDEVRGVLSFGPAVVRTKHGAPLPQYAVHRAALLADGPPVQVMLEPPRMPPGGHLEVEYEDFRQSGSPSRAANADALSVVDLVGDVPKLWLNRGIPNLELVLNSRARRGARARIREAMYQSIATQTWTSLVAASLAALAASLRDDPQGNAGIDALPDWQQRVIRFWSVRLIPSSPDVDQAIDEVCRIASRAAGVAELLEAAVPAVQRWTRTGSAFEGLVRIVTQDGV